MIDLFMCLKEVETRTKAAVLLQCRKKGAKTSTIIPSAIKAKTNNNDLIISYFVTETDLNLINLSKKKLDSSRRTRIPTVGR